MGSDVVRVRTLSVFEATGAAMRVVSLGPSVPFGSASMSARVTAEKKVGRIATTKPLDERIGPYQSIG